jgi:hypothetical protein
MQLAPEHLKDLKKSGLTDETIEAAGIYTVLPGDIIKIIGWNMPIRSLLAFPYPNCDHFIRYKLFPPHKQNDGHHIRYFQPKGSDTHIYFPPRFDRNSEIIRITEGEKKAAKGTQDGLNVLGLGGIWNFAVKGEDGSPHLIEDFALIEWKCKKVEIIPDSDFFQKNNIKHAVFRLGTLLEAQGAIITIVCFHDPHTKKIGLDDFLVKNGVSAFFDPETTHRFDLSHNVFNKVRKTENNADKLDATTRGSQAEKLVNLIDNLKVQLLHDEKKRPHAAVINNNVRMIYRIRSKEFKSWVAHQFWMKEDTVPNADALNSALNVLEGKALYDGKKHTLNNRVAWYENEMWYDLTDENWQAIRITDENWQVVEKPPILFRRYTHQMPQVMPHQEGNIDLLWNFVNIKDEQNRLLVKVLLIASFISDIAHPVLVPYGEQGTAKTTLCKILKQIVDPSVIDVLQLPKDKTEFIQLLDHHWMACFDNVSALSIEYSDLLCRAVTGQGFSKRELFTDDEDVIYFFKRNIALNGINIAVTLSDLMDRSILLELQPITDSERMEEKRLWEEFQKAKPFILGGIFNVLSRSLKLYDETNLPRLFRMADFTRWGCAITTALGYDSDDFIGAYKQNITTQNEEVLGSNAISHVLCHFMKDKTSWQGTANALSQELENLTDDLQVNTKDRSWPKAANSLTRKLNVLKPNLRRTGIVVSNYKNANGRFIRLSKTDGHDGIADAINGSKTISSEQKCSNIIEDDDMDGNDGISQSLGSEDSFDFCIDEKG